MPARRPVLILDACTALNVLATARWTEVFAAAGRRPVMSRHAAKETIWLDGEDGERESVDLHAMMTAQQLEIWDVVDYEIEEMLRFAVRLGAGEASCLALARCRGLPLATDDRAARRAANDQTPGINLVSTAQLLHDWSADRDKTEVGRTLRAVEARAAFRPPSSDPRSEWWDVASRSPA